MKKTTNGNTKQMKDETQTSETKQNQQTNHTNETNNTQQQPKQMRDQQKPSGLYHMLSKFKRQFLDCCLSSGDNWNAAAIAAGNVVTYNSGGPNQTSSYVRTGEHRSRRSRRASHVDIGMVFNETMVVQLSNVELWGFKLHSMKEGALVIFSADPGEKGYMAGIRNGDILKQVGNEIIDTETAKEALNVIKLQKSKSHTFGKANTTTVAVKVLRAFLDVELPAHKPWGFSLEELDDHTLHVKSAKKDGYGYMAGIRDGDCLSQVGDEMIPPVCSAQKAFQIIKKHKEKADHNNINVVIRRPAAIPGTEGKYLFRDQSLRRQEKRNTNHLNRQLATLMEEEKRNAAKKNGILSNGTVQRTLDAKQ